LKRSGPTPLLGQILKIKRVSQKEYYFFLIIILTNGNLYKLGDNEMINSENNKLVLKYSNTDSIIL